MDEFDESSDVEMMPIEEIDRVKTTSATELEVTEIILILIDTVVNQCHCKKRRFKLYSI